MKKINVKKEQCIGCGACVAIDPDHFDFDDEGRSTSVTRCPNKTLFSKC